MNENKIKNEKETLKDNKPNSKTIDLNLLDKTPISKLLTFSAKELFQIQEQASLEFEKANYRKKWIDGVIELKYKATIESAYKKAIAYFNSEPLVELDKYNEDNLTEYIEDNGLIIKVEFYRSISDITDRPQVKKRFTLLQATSINKKSKR
ncbi:MAG TPA: hypothetical protein VLL98_02260 [Rickettsiales bacterium]|nr:hypothetical protein [Rickettsiales bacterium]